ncbi:efflux RND transporter periplasmic adaptor subunit, partial [Thioclava dalianensis]|uniref:efflux RND transporter periplasmic adaptor subunit n=1 Tax=Thioclava dalianensis TaxID=1185766 RepID=UPI000570514E
TILPPPATDPTKVLYTSGKKLQAGDPMFQLDTATYQATVDSDQAALDKAQAAIPTDQANYDRALKLEGQGYTAAQVAGYKSTLEEDQASVKAAQAALDYAKVQLGWTTVRSPIAGYPAVPSVTDGNVVTASQNTALTTVTRLDPIEVDVLEPSASILSIRKLVDEGKMTPSSQIVAKLTLENGEVYTSTGQLVAPAPTVSTTTGTVSIRFRFDNPHRQILPGMFLHAQVQLGTVQGFLIPQEAANVTSDGKITVFLEKNGRAASQTLTETGSYQNQWVVTSGLEDGDKLIVDGLKYMGAGRPVAPVPATVGKDGAVTRQNGGANAKSAAPAAAKN